MEKLNFGNADLRCYAFLYRGKAQDETWRADSSPFRHCDAPRYAHLVSQSFGGMLGDEEADRSLSLFIRFSPFSLLRSPQGMLECPIRPTSSAS